MGFNLATVLQLSAERVPDRMALDVGGQALTYAQLRERVRSVASVLKERAGVQVGSRVAIVARRSLDTYLGILGTLWAGGTYVPLNPQLPEERLVRMLERTRVQALVADPEHAPRVTARLRGEAPLLVPSLEPSSAAPGPEVPVPVPDDHVAYVEFTSGTTGFPKGVLVPGSAVEQFLAVCRSQFQVDERDRVAGMSDITFDLSVFDMFFAWDRGAALHVVPPQQTMAPLGFFQERALSVALVVPSVAAMLGRMKLLRPGSLPQLRVSLFCGEPLPLASAQAWAEAAPHGELWNLYGPTEATVACSLQRYEQARTPALRGVMGLGHPFPGTEFCVLGPDDQLLPPEAAGELAIGGPQLALGYDGDAEKTAQKFFTRAGQRWYRTGDQVQRDAEGRYFHLGRTDNQIKVRGMRVELEDVESHLRDVFDTQAVAAVAWPTRHGSADGIVAFVCAELTPPRLTELRKALQKRLPSYMVPTAVHLVAALPLNPNGKVDRAALRARLDGPGGAPGSEPGSGSSPGNAPAS